MNIKMEFEKVVKPAFLSQEQKLWLVSLSSFLSLPNSYSLDTLQNVSEKYTPEAVKSANLNVLNKSYDIHDKDDFIETLQTFSSTARSQDFKYLMMEWAKPDLYINRLYYNLEKYKGTSVEVASEWAERFKIELSHCGIKAFDLGRSAFLCRCAFTVGLISEEEAWYHLLQIGRLAHKLFNSWYEFALSYSVGRLCWLNINFRIASSSKVNSNTAENIRNETKEGFSLAERIHAESKEIEEIFSDDSHPWCQLDWRIAL